MFSYTYNKYKTEINLKKEKDNNQYVYINKGLKGVLYGINYFAWESKLKEIMQDIISLTLLYRIKYYIECTMQQLANDVENVSRV